MYNIFKKTFYKILYFRRQKMIVSVIGGTGPQGLGIALRLAIEGVEVIVGSRKEEKALDVVAEAKEKYADYDLNIKGLANEDAANCRRNQGILY